MSEGLGVSLLGLHGWPGASAAGLAVVLGPSLRSVGKVLGDWSDYRLRNLFSIGDKARRQLGNAPEAGQVHPRVAHRVIEEGSWVDDDVMQEYLAGMLRASRTPTGGDDRAAYYVNLLASLTANQVRLHHAIYDALAAHKRPGDLDIANTGRVHEISVRAPLSSASVLLSNPHGAEDVDLVDGAVLGLYGEGLVGDGLAVGTPENLAGAGTAVTEPTCLVLPSAVGALLYLWGRGLPTARADDLGRRPIRPLDPPGPVLAGVTVGPWPGLPVTMD